DAPRRLIRTRLLNSKAFAFAASKRTAKTERLTRVRFEALLDLLGKNSLRFKPRFARIANFGKALPFGVAKRREGLE
ncbi:MAG: hypothetical protein IJW97_00395, partial [Clostridia bacterium]|nr:hypothetical protein [Clostridia bacterium]